MGAGGSIFYFLITPWRGLKRKESRKRIPSRIMMAGPAWISINCAKKMPAILLSEPMMAPPQKMAAVRSV